ncbi:nickel pincer cofactor biosynthesis protein LarB [Palleronia aestuarii]|uniref:nickel pincer cofactor biosynthesis protein LarB n=1 Tax=Palleronia aestuarii TaxID=568105 RepID=UPI001F36C408|nr:nickel pincer cofactor biosynthesis protein LarB [Palleronia aestuarii]
MQGESSPGARFDWQRVERTGLPEAIYCERKSITTILGILRSASDRQESLLLTRLAPEIAAELNSLGSPLDYDADSRTAYFGRPPPAIHEGAAAIVCAGSADLSIASEAARSLRFLGIPAPIYADVGVAGLWRLLDVAEELRQYRVLIAVAGMEGALFSVLAGLVPGIVIAVPTSVGYGVTAGGRAALSSALGSCAPGLLTVNIDNGFGAAAAVAKLFRMQ